MKFIIEVYRHRRTHFYVHIFILKTKKKLKKNYSSYFLDFHHKIIKQNCICSNFIVYRVIIFNMELSLLLLIMNFYVFFCCQLHKIRMVCLIYIYIFTVICIYIYIYNGVKNKLIIIYVIF